MATSPSPALPPTSIVDLEIEVLANIFAYVDDESPRTTPSIAQVNQYFNDAVQLVRYRHQTLRWSTDLRTFVNPHGRRPKDRNSAVALRGLRHLTISKGHERGQGPLMRAQLRDLLRQTSNLKSLIWNDGHLPPNEVLRLLEAQYPRCQLKVYHYAKRGSNYQSTTPDEVALASSQCLTTFDVEMPRQIGGPPEGYHRAFKYVVRRAPNLDHASMTSFGIHATHIEQWELPDPAQKPNTALRHLSLDGWPVAVQTLDYWAHYIDLGLLETFKCTRGPLYASYFGRAADVLKNLKHVSLNLSPFNCGPEVVQAVEHYIATCTPLLTLSLWSWMGKVSLFTILSQHGPTLQDLQLHMREEEMNQERSRILTIHELRLVRRSCPNLNKLTLDVDRKSSDLKLEDYQETLDELKLFHLDELQLYLDSGLTYMTLNPLIDVFSDDEDLDEENPDVGDAHSDHATNRLNACGGSFTFNDLPPKTISTHPSDTILYPPSPTKDIERFAGEVWKCVFGGCVTGPRELHLKFGEWERKEMPVVFRPDGEVQKDLRVWVKARPHERDDKKGECEIEIKCCQGKHWKRFTTDY